MRGRADRPVRRPGRLGFDVARVTAAGLGVLAVAVGAPPRGGPLGVLAVAVLLAGWTLGYAGLYDVVGLKARSPEALTALVPLWWSPAGLPAGVHFLGRFGDEATLLRLASQLEQARPWAGRWPVPGPR